jgi:hypothetical protein
MASSLARGPDGPTIAPALAPHIGETAEPGSANYGRAVLFRALIGALPDAAASLRRDAVGMDIAARRSLRREHP